MLPSRTAVVFLVCLAVGLPASARADTIIWGNNASATDVIEAFNITTGAVVQQFAAPNPAAANANGRGIAVVGHTIYYSTANDGRIFKTNDITHSDDGVFVNTGFGGNGVATIAFDGTLFYATGYQGNNTTNIYDINGTFIRSISGLGNGRDGFEVANNFIIANRGDLTGPYDKYDLNGNLVSLNFIVPDTTATTGITFDGTDYYVSVINSNKIEIFDSNGTFIRSQTLGLPLPNTGTGARLLEDLSALGNVPGNPPPGGGVPEPSTLTLIGAAIIGWGVMRGRLGSRRRRKGA